MTPMQRTKLDRQELGASLYLSNPGVAVLERSTADYSRRVTLELCRH